VAVTHADRDSVGGLPGQPRGGGRAPCQTPAGQRRDQPVRSRLRQDEGLWGEGRQRG